MSSKYDIHFKLHARKGFWKCVYCEDDDKGIIKMEDRGSTSNRRKHLHHIHSDILKQVIFTLRKTFLSNFPFFLHIGILLITNWLQLYVNEINQIFEIITCWSSTILFEKLFFSLMKKKCPEKKRQKGPFYLLDSLFYPSKEVLQSQPQILECHLLQMIRHHLQRFFFFLNLKWCSQLPPHRQKWAELI